jgi:hypothetical protein
MNDPNGNGRKGDENTLGLAPLQSFVTKAIPMPPGTRPAPRDRKQPAPAAPSETSTDEGEIRPGAGES